MSCAQATPRVHWPHAEGPTSVRNARRQRNHVGGHGGQIEFMGETTWGTIVFGEETAEPLLGVTALESVGIDVDPRNQTLHRLPGVGLR